ncbi:MAG: NUDIX domain-containing protein [bacterium]|nr:NUDIX domain-containing protein [bacterium]
MNPKKAPDKVSTLCFLTKNDELLLAMKKRGFGEGKWNGVGGKVNFNESIIQAAIRETEEEIHITPTILDHRATITFYYINEQNTESWEVHVFFCSKWEGEPSESEEMKPQWFNIKDIPYSNMWPDDTYWLPEVLANKNITAEFIFQNKSITSYKISSDTASPLAVTMICLNEDGDVLLRKREKDPDNGKWELVGGHVKSGERLEEAVRRILKDKVNIVDILSIEFTGHYYDDPNRHPNAFCIPLTFKVHTPNAKLKEVINASWFEKQYLDQLEYALDDKQMLVDAGILQHVYY